MNTLLVCRDPSLAPREHRTDHVLARGEGPRVRGAFCRLMLWSCSAILAFTHPTLAQERDALQQLGSEYSASIRPLVRQFCLKCHAADLQEGELDLERFASLDDVRRDPVAWQKVAEMLDDGEMPPKNARQPSAIERERLRTWIDRYLDAEARARAGDPGPVVLRRLNNAEYTYTVRDLTGVSLEPAREFPPDGAAGEGFTNTGSALVMSPAMLTKYLDAAKSIARHAVLLPDGVRFARGTTRRDWTDELLGEIRQFYARYSDREGASRVNLQGVVFDTNVGGRPPLERYFEALLSDREPLDAGTTTIAELAHARGLSAKYLGGLRQWLLAPPSGPRPSPLVDGLRTRFRAAKPGDAAELAAEVARWQQSLWRFTSVGHIGKVGGPKAWMEPVDPITTRHELRWKIPTPDAAHDVVFYLTAGDAGDGNEQDIVVWDRPRLVVPGRPDVLLRDVRELVLHRSQWRDRLFADAAACLRAAAEVEGAEPPDTAALAAKHRVDAVTLAAWLDLLGFGAAPPRIESPIERQSTGIAGYAFVRGWVGDNALSVVANSSDQHVRIPGNMAPHSVAVHPTPTLQVAVGWRAHAATVLRIDGRVQHAHPECGNGVAWSLELRRGRSRQRLAAGTAQGPNPVTVGPLDAFPVRPGDLVSIIIAPRDGNHACDLTAVDLTLRDGSTEWNLSSDVSPDILAGNPHADRHGNRDVWHFYSEPVGGATAGSIPLDSVLARWQAASGADAKAALAEELQLLFARGPSSLPKDAPDALLYRQLASLTGPLLAAVPAPSKGSRPPDGDSRIGVDPALFGLHPDGSEIDPASLCVRAPAAIEVRLPADLAAGAELVTSGTLHESGAGGSVQLQVLTEPPGSLSELIPATLSESTVNGPWTSNNRRAAHATPILVRENSAAQKRIRDELDVFRHWFPAALCYTKIVPVDEVVTLTLFHREDDHLRRLMLEQAEAEQLDRLWRELFFVSHEPIALVDAFEQLMEYASQDADPKVFAPLRKPIHDRADAFRRALADAEPQQLQAVIDFAERAYRRPLAEPERSELAELYRRLREQELPHDEAIRFTLSRILVAPAFLYRIETGAAASSGPAERDAPSGRTGPATMGTKPVSDWELATRLSYFLWSSIPDDELRAAAAGGRMHDPAVLSAQARRMLRDSRTQRVAREFACQWLQIYEFDKLDEKSERHYPQFAELRGAMYEESVRFFADLFQNDGSVLSILAADHTFVNGPLAAHYGIANVSGPDWQPVTGLRNHGRGGILGQAAPLAKHSGASRTSPILRGNWISEVLLGEKLPRPPKDVPQLPDDESATDGLTVRQLVERHSSDPSCSKCHARIDPLGFALEAFDTIGARRDRDLADRPIDARGRLRDGTELDGLDGLRDYLLGRRRDDFVRQFCRKLLGYALGRSVQLSDEPLLDAMQGELARTDYRVSGAIERIVTSDQFRRIRVSD